MKYKKIILLLLLIGFVITGQAIAQTGMSPQNVSNIRVDQMTDDQIKAIMMQMGGTGLTNDQMAQRALSMGMSPAEAQKFQLRAMRMKSMNNSGFDQEQRASQGRGSRRLNFDQNADSAEFSLDTLTAAEKAALEFRKRIFGTSLFSNKRITFEPNLRVATPPNYQIGPDDEVIIDIFGFSEANYKLNVTPEGTIVVPSVGVIQIGGMNVDQATARIRSRLSSVYSNIRSGNTSVSVSIGNIRGIKVILTGEIQQPGTYTLPSLATAFNALYSSGGPTVNGSFRKVEVIRGGTKVATLDVYDFLLTGSLKNDIRLRDQDVIRIPTYQKRVEVEGEVKTPAIFELLEGESLSDLLRFSGGFTESAYQARIKVLKNTDTERKIADITADKFGTYIPASGDKFYVDQILDRFANRVTIAGAIFRPGEYELEPGLTVSRLIQKAEGLREDAFANRAYITRLKDNMQSELISFDISKVLSGQADDIALRREDIVTISSIFDLQEEYQIRVEGEVRAPGSFKYSEGITLEDAILQAGGFRESATTNRVEVSRRVKNSDALSLSARTAEVFQMDVSPGLNNIASSFKLEPFDIVSIRPSAGYEVQRQVRVEGEVLYPGIYTLEKKDERLSDLIARAGGFTALAYAEGASLKRPGKINVDSIATAKMLQKALLANAEHTAATSKDPAAVAAATAQLQGDTTKSNTAINRNEFVGIDLPKIIKSPRGIEDLFLEEGDILIIPKQLQTVKVSGQVLSPVTVVYANNKSFKRYISNAGGFGVKSSKKRSYIKYANGAVRSTRRILFFNNYPSVKPGSEIVVPEGPAKRPLNVTELVGISTSIVTLIILLNQLSGK